MDQLDCKRVCFGFIKKVTLRKPANSPDVNPVGTFFEVTLKIKLIMKQNNQILRQKYRGKSFILWNHANCIFKAMFTDYLKDGEILIGIKHVTYWFVIYKHKVTAFY